MALVESSATASSASPAKVIAEPFQQLLALNKSDPLNCSSRTSKTETSDDSADYEDEGNDDTRMITCDEDQADDVTAALLAHFDQEQVSAAAHHALPEVVTEADASLALPLPETDDKPLSSSSPLSSRQRRTSSILKSVYVEQIPIKIKRGVWKQLHPPDLNEIYRSVAQRASMSHEDNAPKRTRPRSLSVSFQHILIRNYNQTVGDNPSVSYGMPIQLDWDYEEMTPITVDLYEDNRGKRRSPREMVLSYYQRRNILTWQYGFSEDVLKTAKKAANRIKFERSVTRTLLPVMLMESTLESAARKAKRIVKGGQ
jgi:hypothetical protein